MTLRTKRIHDEPAAADGYRVLVDRLWPRGISKDRADLGEWCKEVAPSDALRREFHGGDLEFDEFERRYRTELRSGEQQAALAHLRDLLDEHGTVTLLFGAKDEEHNQAVVLRELLEG